MAYLESKYSNQVSAKLAEDQLAPAQVENLSYTVKQGEVLLAWSAVTKNADGSDLTDLAGYRVYRKGKASENFELIGSVPGDQLSYTDKSVKDGLRTYMRFQRSIQKKFQMKVKNQQNWQSRLSRLYLLA